jgi:hypothetical protein
MDTINFIGGFIACGILGMSSSAGEVLTVRAGGRASPIFPNVKNDKSKKKFLEKEHKLRRISSKAPIKRPIKREMTRLYHALYHEKSV